MDADNLEEMSRKLKGAEQFQQNLLLSVFHVKFSVSKWFDRIASGWLFQKLIEKPLCVAAKLLDSIYKKIRY